jgi:hypothetical protein
LPAGDPGLLRAPVGDGELAAGGQGTVRDQGEDGAFQLGVEAVAREGAVEAEAVPEAVEEPGAAEGAGGAEGETLLLEGGAEASGVGRLEEAADAVGEALEGGAVDLVEAAEVVEDPGLALAGGGVAEVIGELEVLDG